MSMDDALQRHEIPTHLEVEDRILFGLTLRQGVILLLGATAGYFLFAQSGQGIAGVYAPLAVRIGVGLLPVLVALVVALIQPAGRPLEDWFFAIARYLTVPKQCVWCPRFSRVVLEQQSQKRAKRGNQGGAGTGRHAAKPQPETRGEGWEQV